MNGRPQVDSSRETPVYVPAGDDDLFGVFTEPVGAPAGIAAVILPGGGSTAANRNRLAVHLARTLAADGYHAMRFDYHGVGESTGVLAGSPKVDEPFLEDIGAILGWIHDRGVPSSVLLGACFGARTALSAAPNVPGIRAVALISPPLRDLGMEQETGTRLAMRIGAVESLRRALRPTAIRGLRHPARRATYRQFVSFKAQSMARRVRWALSRHAGVDDRWVSPRFLGPIEALAARKVPVLFAYGRDDHHYHDFLVARAGRLGRVLAGAPLTDIVVLEGQVHGLASVEVQRRVGELVLGWLERRVGVRAGASA